VAPKPPPTASQSGLFNTRLSRTFSQVLTGYVVFYIAGTTQWSTVNALPASLPNMSKKLVEGPVAGSEHAILVL